MSLTKKIQEQQKMSEKEKGSTEFPSLDGFLEWAGHNEIKFPLPNGKGWTVVLSKEKGVLITSDFYEVRGDPDGYGAPKPFGHLLPLGEEMVSGLVEVGSSGEIVNRRRAVTDDRIGDNQEILEGIQTQPDRVNEPVAVIITGSLADYSSDPKVWNQAINNARDGVELMAIQAVMTRIFE